MSPQDSASPLIHDLSSPEYDPPDAPAWVKEEHPDFIMPFVGKNGLGPPWQDRPGPLAPNVRGLDRYQANNFIAYRRETARYLYTQYTPLKVKYRRGVLPGFEALSAQVVAGCRTDTDKAVALLLKACPRVRHPSAPPCSPPVACDRNLDDEALLTSGMGWCNEQGRVFIRLCQVNGIPARLVHLFYSDRTTGHTVAEFYADGRWAMADATWLCVFPDVNGRLLSAEQCHDGGEGQRCAGKALYRRTRELLSMSDAELNLPRTTDTAEWRRKQEAHTARSLADRLWRFAVINYPLPR